MNQYYSKTFKEELSAVDDVNKTISVEKLNSYFKITAEAIEKVETSEIDLDNVDKVNDFLLMAKSYYDDAKFFAFKKQDFVLAFGALNYAHAWLDAGARLKFFKVNDSRLFTVDD
jgi:hypothetical protein